MRHEYLQIGMALHHAREDEAHRGDAHLDYAAERDEERAVVAVDEHVLEYGVGRMKEQRDAKLLDIVVERLEPLGIDAWIIADAARKVDAHEAELVDRVIDDID